jgi:arylsulfatase A-like enzyme
MAENMSDLGRETKCLGHWPDFTLVYFPGPDDVAHFNGGGSTAYRRALKSLDCSLGQILRAFECGGVIDKMTLVLTADHGMHDVGRCNWRDVAQLLRDQAGIEAYGSQSDLDEYVPWMDNENDASLTSRTRRFDRWCALVTTAGERQASIHLRCGWTWSSRPAYQQILWYHRPGENAESRSEDASLPALLVADPAVAFAAVRDGAYAVQLFGKGGIARIERQTGGKAGSYSYRVVSGTDPLFGSDPAPPPLADGAFHPSRDWLAATAASSHPDAVAQLGDLFDTRKAGEIVLFAAPGYDFSKKYVGGHGGLERDEMTIPMYFAGPRFEPGRTIPAGRLVDLVPTVLDLMGLKQRTAESCRMDGASLLPELLANEHSESRRVALAK